ncbi:MAG: hypothetical protein V4590_03950 [Bacteroidota bacterium]
MLKTIFRLGVLVALTAVTFDSYSKTIEVEGVLKAGSAVNNTSAGTVTYTTTCGVKVSSICTTITVADNVPVTFGRAYLQDDDLTENDQVTITNYNEDGSTYSVVQGTFVDYSYEVNADDDYSVTHHYTFVPTN